MPPGLWWPSETSCPEALGGNLEPPKDVVVVVGEQMRDSQIWFFSTCVKLHPGFQDGGWRFYFKISLLGIRNIDINIHLPWNCILGRHDMARFKRSQIFIINPSFEKFGWLNVRNHCGTVEIIGCSHLGHNFAGCKNHGLAICSLIRSSVILGRTWTFEVSGCHSGAVREASFSPFRRRERFQQFHKKKCRTSMDIL